MNSSISFIVPLYNNQDTIIESLESILNTNLSQGDEIIVIDDASNDNSYNVVKSFAVDKPSIKIFRHKYNKGSAAASRNSGIEYAVNELIFCLDADNILVENSISKLKKHLIDTNSDAAAFEGKYFFKDSKENITNKWFYKNSPITLEFALSSRFWPGPSGNYLFTRETWIKAGRYNENVGGAIDSWAFGIKQLASGSKMVILPETYYLHRHGYDSTYVKGEKTDNLNIRALNVISEIYPLIDEKDLTYIYSNWGRSRWLTNIEKRPIKLKTNMKYSKLKLIMAEIRMMFHSISS
jgi:glycosyltransferase involved in cell wall biosynthesis